MQHPLRCAANSTRIVFFTSLRPSGPRTTALGCSCLELSGSSWPTAVALGACVPIRGVPAAQTEYHRHHDSATDSDHEDDAQPAAGTPAACTSLIRLCG